MLSIHLFQKLFTENKISQKLNDIFESYKNSIVVCTQSFHIKGKANFWNQTPYDFKKIFMISSLNDKNMDKFLFS